jgi:hypothetical protein
VEDPRKLSEADDGRSKAEFVDPTPGLAAEYEEALAKLEAEFANKKRLVDRWRLRREKQRLAERFAIIRTVPRW